MNATTPSAPGLGARLARNSLHSASGRIVAMIAWIAVTPPLVRALGPDGFGIWSLFYALTGWLGSMDFGFAQIALRFGAAARARDADRETGEYATLSVAVFVVLGVLWLAIAAVAREPLLDLLRISGDARPLAAQAIVAGAIVFMVSGLANTTQSTLQAWDRFDLANVVSLTTSLATVLGLTIAIATHAGLSACLAAVIAGWALAAVVGIALLATGVPSFRWASIAAARQRIGPTLGFGVPVQVSNALAVTHQMTGKLLLVRMVALAAVVPYELGLRVSTACFTFAQLAMVAILPEASALHATEQADLLQALHRRAGRFITAIAAVLTAGLLGAATPLFGAWLGHPDANATLALRGLAIAAYFAVIGGLVGAIARGVGRINFEVEWSGLALVTHLVLGVLLVPRMGLTGALAAIAAANLIAGLWFASRLGRALRWPIAPLLVEPLVVPIPAMVLGALAGVWLARMIVTPWWSLLASGALAGGVTLGVLLALRHVEWREITSLARRAVGA